MKIKFALPIAAALILHAALLFGFSGPPEAVQSGDAIGPHMIIDEIPTAIEIVDILELSESTVGDESSEQIQGDPDSQNIALPDFPRPEPPKSFTMPVEPFVAVSLTEAIIEIKSGLKGAIDGDLDGVFRKRGPITSGMLDSSLRAIVQPAPLYPDEATIHGIEGQVLLGFTVDETGRVVRFRMAVPIIFSLND